MSHNPPKLQFAIHDGPVRNQHAPYFEVLSKGTMIEYTDMLPQAVDAYLNAGLPREMVRIDVVAGRATRTVIERMSAIQHKGAK